MDYQRTRDLDFLKVHFNSKDEEGTESNVLHENLLKDISDISGKHIKSNLRKEMSGSMLNMHSLDKVSLMDLIPKDNNNTDLFEIKKKLLKENIVEKPMPKSEHEKLRRQIGYDEAVKEASQWDSLVHENRKAIQMKFPLAKADVITVHKLNNLDKDAKPNTKLEQEVTKVLRESGKNLTRHEEKTLLSHLDNSSISGMSLKGAQEMRAECLKQKALVSYYAAKMKRQNKIKSKKYHRVQKRAKHKQEAQKLEVIKDKDPEAYQEWLLKKEKKRIEERMTLKHRGNSKQMRKHLSYGKFNLEAREAQNEMMEMRKELSQKICVKTGDGGDSDSISEDEADQSDVEKNEVLKRRFSDDNNEDECITSEFTMKAKKQKSEEDVLNSIPFETIDQELELDNNNILGEFNDEKAAIEERDKVKDVNTFVEGWGSWSGKGINISRKKIKRFTIKAPLAPHRKDSSLSHVIISELKNTSIAKHQVDDLPRKFKNIPKFQESICKPLGKQWNKEDKYKQMIRPKILVKSGCIIENVSKSEALKRHTTSKKDPQKAKR